MKSTDNLDLFLHSDQAKARASRIAADTVRYDPHFTEEERIARALDYEADADRYEARARRDSSTRGEST